MLRIFLSVCNTFAGDQLKMLAAKGIVGFVNKIMQRRAPEKPVTVGLMTGVFKGWSIDNERHQQPILIKQLPVTGSGSNFQSPPTTRNAAGNSICSQNPGLIRSSQSITGINKKPEPPQARGSDAGYITICNRVISQASPISDCTLRGET